MVNLRFNCSRIIGMLPLQRANLKCANFNHATLERANLQEANLTESSAIGTNFTETKLSGACIECWNIDSSTVLSRVDCQFIYLLEHCNVLGHQERLPHNPDKIFQRGDFERIFKEVLDEVKLLIRDGINPEAFRAAFQKLMQEYGVTRESVQKVEKKGSDVLLVIQVPEGTDKAKVEQDWDETYQARLEAVKNAALLESERRRADDFKEIHLTTVASLGNLLSNLTINATAMTDSNNPSINVSAGGSVGAVGGGDVEVQGVVNLGTISGVVTNTINQLQESSEPDAPQLADLLKQLKTAIDQSKLNEKAKALKHLDEIAKLVQ